MMQTERLATATFSLDRLALILTLLCALAIGMSTLLPLAPVPGPPGNDKTLHLLAFAALVLPMAIACPRRLLWLVPLACAYGGAIELLQPLVGRENELWDWIADISGVAAGATFGLLMHAVLFRSTHS